MQPVNIVVYQGGQCTIFSLNTGNGDPNETSSTGIWRHTGMRLTAAEEYPQGGPLGEPNATRALLQFLACTSVALPQEHLWRMSKRAQGDDERGLEALEEASRREG